MDRLYRVGAQPPQMGRLLPARLSGRDLHGLGLRGPRARTQSSAAYNGDSRPVLRV